MKRLTLILTMMGIITHTYSQSTLLWSEDFKIGLSNYYSEHPNLQVTGDTIKVTGRKNTASGQRLLIVKYDLLGNPISTKTYGNDSVHNNTIIDYKFDAANHIYILNKEQLGYYKSKIVLQKYSLEGNLIWVEQIQNPADTSYRPHSLALANDTCLFMGASKEFDYPEPGDDVFSTKSLSCLYTFNTSGNLLWQREFNAATEINWYGYEFFVYDNTAFLFALKNKMVKVDINNNLTIDTNTSTLNGVFNILPTPDNNLIITWPRYRFSKVNLHGSLIWTQHYETNLPSNVTGDEMKAIIQDSAGNIYVTGRHYGSDYGTPTYTNADILTLKYDSDGNLIWENRYEYGVNNADIGNTIALKNGHIYVGGQSQGFGKGTGYDYVVLKIDSATGVSKGVYRYDGFANGHDVVSSLHVFDNGNVALTGLSYINSQYDWTTQLLSDVILPAQYNYFQVYPNPVTRGENLTIIGKDIKSYSVISLLGQVVQEGNFDSKDTHTIQLNNFKAGMYLLYLKTDHEITTKKIIVR